MLLLTWLLVRKQFGNSLGRTEPFRRSFTSGWRSSTTPNSDGRLSTRNCPWLILFQGLLVWIPTEMAHKIAWNSVKRCRSTYACIEDLHFGDFSCFRGKCYRGLPVLRACADLLRLPIHCVRSKAGWSACQIVEIPGTKSNDFRITRVAWPLQAR